MREVLITGVHRGLGHGLARCALDAGDRVRAFSRARPDDLADGDRFRFRSLDLAEHGAIPAAVEGLVSDAPRIDLAILNAGIFGEIADLADTTVDDLRHVMDVNVWANKVVLDALYAAGKPPAQVIGISSGAAINGSGGWGGYSISKAALNLLLRVYAGERPETHFTALAPGIIETAMTRTIRDHPGDPRHAATARVQGAFEQGSVRTETDAARAILERLDVFREYPSGSYLDIRDL